MAEIGDIYEISFSSGYGYVKVTHHHQTYLDVLRIDTKKYDHALDDPSNANFEVLVLYPLSHSIESGKIKARKCLSDPSSAESTPFPEFRFAVLNRRGDPIYWWIWNGDSIKPADPDKDISDLPIRQILSPDEFNKIWHA